MVKREIAEIEELRAKGYEPIDIRNTFQRKKEEMEEYLKDLENRNLDIQQQIIDLKKTSAELYSDITRSKKRIANIDYVFEHEILWR